MSWKRRCRRKRARSIWMRRASKPAVRSRAGTLANRRPYRTRTGAVGGSHQPQTKDTRTARRAASGPSIVSLEGPPSDQHWRACALRRRDPLSTRDRSRSEVTRVAAGQALSARPAYRVQDRAYNSQDSDSPGQDPGVPGIVLRAREVRRQRFSKFGGTPARRGCRCSTRVPKSARDRARDDRRVSKPSEGLTSNRSVGTVVNRRHRLDDAHEKAQTRLNPTESGQFGAEHRVSNRRPSPSRGDAQYQLD